MTQFSSRVSKPKTFPKISFCTTCKGRVASLLETLPQNIKNSSDWPNSEFVILSYGDDEVISKIKEQFPNEIATGKIRLAHVDAEYFEYSHAKNVAHRLATGEILCNLDADNILGQGYAKWLGDCFTTKDMNVREDVVVRALLEDMPSPQAPGCGGRLAISRTLFDKLGGYKETISYWGGEDRDLCARAVVAGARFMRNPEHVLGKALYHSDGKRSDMLSEKDRNKSIEALKISYAIRNEFAPMLDEHWARTAGKGVFSFLPEYLWGDHKYNEEGKLVPTDSKRPLSPELVAAFWAGQEELTTPRPGLEAVANRDTTTSRLNFGCAEATLITRNPDTPNFQEEVISLEPIPEQQQEKISRAR